MTHERVRRSRPFTEQEIARFDKFLEILDKTCDEFEVEGYLRRVGVCEHGLPVYRATELGMQMAFLDEQFDDHTNDKGSTA